MSEVVIRPARETDLPQLEAIERSAAEAFEGIGQPIAAGETLSPAEALAALSAGLLWVAEEPGSGPVGFLAAERRDGGLYVAELDVLVSHQRRGIGRCLMQTAIAHARSERLADVTLTTFRAIPWNAPFYSSLGFLEVGEAAMPAHLAASLAAQAEHGLRDRCAMRLRL